MRLLKAAHSRAGRGCTGWSSAASGCKCCYAATTSLPEHKNSLDRWPDLSLGQHLLTPRSLRLRDQRDRCRQERELTARVELSSDRFTARDADQPAERFVADAGRLIVLSKQPVGPLDEARSPCLRDDK